EDRVRGAAPGRPRRTGRRAGGAPPSARDRGGGAPRHDGAALARHSLAHAGHVPGRRRHRPARHGAHGRAAGPDQRPDRGGRRRPLRRAPPHRPAPRRLRDVGLDRPAAGAPPGRRRRDPGHAPPARPRRHPRPRRRHERRGPRAPRRRAARLRARGGGGM
ncbi:MAG: hypothetical protein AVDCRST_MAG68-4791, partial [uncultured Gemmatimonadetes bacterium]